ncbi:disease resistance protein RPM1-like [Durio zibethinus]|uniref:Disease resistance protein RPM1-like n=1 Tax=Durio zibethinus TaxID=66656 RepID=A0A6P5WP13_DURZI|nr:disease resistance protein RPM1-like [Durio zibethinus]
MADAAVTAALLLIEKVSSFLAQEVNLKKKLQDNIEDVRNWLRTIHAHLRDVDGKEGSALQIERSNQLRDIAYDIEDVLDEFQLHVPVPHQFHRHTVSKMAHDAAHSVKHRYALHQLSSGIKGIRRKKENLREFDPRHLHLAEGSSSGSRVEDHHLTKQIPQEDEIVGFDEQKAKLMQQLLEEGEARRMTISVVGPAGSGKSVLVKSVYEDKSVVKRYDCHAWIHVSRSSKIDELLWRMLGQFCEGREDLYPPGQDVLDKLKNHLQWRRYLVVLDDLWSKDDWERIVSALPSSFGESRIIIITTNSNVASSCVHNPKLHVHEVKALSWPYDWHLFCKKVFSTSDGVCPKELEELSQDILVKCEGLPFAIVAVASLLSTREKTPTEFKKLYDSLGSEIEAGSKLSKIGKVLLPSYKDLLDKGNLKSCLLYFSIFPEDYSIKRGRLIRLWIAEGFIPEKRGKTVEMVAEEYLDELIGRNLVHVSSRDFDGRVSSCRLLNIVREFIIQKSEEENFVTILAEPSTEPSEKVRRLSFQSKFSRHESFGLNCVRTFFMFDWYDSFSSKIGKLVHRFKWLKVLDLEGAPLETFPKEIVKLTLLKYLSLKETKIKTVPESIKELAYLETLNLKKTLVTKLPLEIRELQFLRHLLVYRYNVKNYVTFDPVQGVEVPPGIGTLNKLQKLSLLRVNKEVLEELGALIQLKKLGILDLKREDGKRLCASIMKMPDLLTLDVSSTGPGEYLDLDGMVNHPRFLQRLKLEGRLAKLPGWISSHSLDNLQRIYLKWSRLNTCDNPLRALEALPNLLELQMVDAYMGKALEFNANSFKKLKILQLEQFANLNMVVVQETAMPKLEKLTICKCKKLEMLPLGIYYLTHLKELLLYDMNENFLSWLNKDCKDRWMADHIERIRTFTLDSNQ